MRYACVNAAFFLIGALGCAHDVAAPVPDPPGPAPSWMSAIVEGNSWNPFSVSVNRDGDVVVFGGEAWMDDEGSTLGIRLFVRLGAGLGPQETGFSSITAADVMFRPWYTAAQAWSASGTNGSGTVTLETLTNDRATGRFSFTAAAVTATTNPATYRVTNGSFNIRF